MPTHPSHPWLHRIQALLAKAESTDYPAEAEALLAKAQELMTRHAIDHAMLAARSQAHDEVVCEPVAVPGPYASAKTALLAHVAAANACRCVVTGGRGAATTCTLVGFASDVSKAITLFAALSMHGVRTMLAAPVPAHDTPRRFRHAFLLAYGGRIGVRLAEAASRARGGSATHGDPGSSVAVVLAARDDQVARAFDEAFPSTRSVRRSASSGAGANAGRSAADRAPLDDVVSGGHQARLGAS